jgi:methylmalonyl-CoA/ethylmalonyl-CoA epimerase
MKVERIDHFHAYAKNVDAAAKLFGELFGTAFDPPWVSDEWGCKVRFHRLGFEFIQPTDPNGLIAQALADRKEGIICISLKVPNMEEAIAEMESRGIKLLHMFQVGQNKEATFDFTNTFGVQIELCEYPGDDIQAASL